MILRDNGSGKPGWPFQTRRDCIPVGSGDAIDVAHGLLRTPMPADMFNYEFVM